MAKIYEISPSQIQKQLVKLEVGRILVSRMTGNLHVFTFSPRLAIKKELLALLEKELSLFTDEITKKYYRERMRPRRTGKDL